MKRLLEIGGLVYPSQNMEAPVEALEDRAGVLGVEAQLLEQVIGHDDERLAGRQGALRRTIERGSEHEPHVLLGEVRDAREGLPFEHHRASVILKSCR